MGGRGWLGFIGCFLGGKGIWGKGEMGGRVNSRHFNFLGKNFISK